MYTLKSATLIPPDGKIVFAVPVDMEWIIVVITDQAGNEMLRMPIERREHLQGGAIVRTYWDGSFIGWKGMGKADPSRGNYFYTVIGEEKVSCCFDTHSESYVKATKKVEVQLPEITPQELPPPIEVFEETQPSTPTWMWVVIGIGVLLLLTKRGD